MKSNAKAASRENDEENHPCYPGVAYCVFATDEMKPAMKIQFFSALHKADMEPTVLRVRTQTELSSLLQVLTEHSNDGIDNLVQVSNAYCYQRAVSEHDEAESCSTLHSLPSKPCRIVEVNEQEMFTRVIKPSSDCNQMG